jgi:hypothetical protein
VRSAVLLVLFTSLPLVAACGSPAPAKPCTVKQNPDGSATITCPDGSHATVKSGTDGSSCSVTDNGDGTKTISCTDGTTATVSNGTNGADGSSCSVTDNGDGTKTVACPDGTTATVADGQNGVTGLSLVQGPNSVSCPAGSKVASFGSVAGSGKMKVSFLFQIEVDNTLYSSVDQPSGPPPASAPGARSLFEVMAGGSNVLYDTGKAIWTTSSPFTATDGSYKLTWTEDPSAPNTGGGNVGMYAYASASATIPGGSQVTGTGGRIGIINDNGPFDIYQLQVDTQVPLGDSLRLGLGSPSLPPVKVSSDLTQVTLDTWPCPNPDPATGRCAPDWATVDVYAICAQTP